MKTYQYRQIKININTEDPENIKLLSVLDGFNAWERNRMILEALIDKFVACGSVGIQNSASSTVSANDSLAEAIAVLTKKVSVLDEKMNNLEGGMMQSMQPKQASQKIEKQSEKMNDTEQEEQELPAGVLDFLSAL